MSVCLTVCFSYGGSKARFTEKSIESVISILREDLTTLKLNHPGTENIKVVGPGRVKFCWPNTVKNGSLHRMYEEKLQSSESSILKTDPERLCALSIVGIEYHCKKVSTFGAFREQKPWKENDDTIVWARDSTRGTASRSHTASEHHQQSDSSKLSASRAEEKGVKVNESENVVDLAIRVREEPASAANMTESRGALSEIHAHSSSEPALDNDIEARLDASSPAGTRSRSDSIGSSSGWKTPLVVASKPTILANDPVIIQDSSMDLIPELDSGVKVAHHRLEDSNVADARIQGPETESKTTKRPRSLSQDDSTLPPFRPPMRAFQLATNAISDTNDFSSNALRDRTSRTSHEFPVPFTRPSPTEPKPNTSNSTADPDPSVAKFAFKPRLIKPLPKAPKAFLQSEQASRTKSKPEVLRASDTSPMAKAYAELSKLRAELSAGAERQNAILEELQKMGAEDVILKPMRAVVAGTAKDGDEMTIDANASEVARTRLRLIEQQIEIEQRKKNIAVQELKAVEREGREPFVVPALLEAFIKLSELTTEAKERISAVAI